MATAKPGTIQRSSVVVQHDNPLEYEDAGYLLSLIKATATDAPTNADDVKSILSPLHHSDTLVFQAGGPYAFFALTRSLHSFPVQAFARGESRNFVQRFGFRVGRFGMDPWGTETQTDVKRFRMLALTTWHISGRLLSLGSKELFDAAITLLCTTLSVEKQEAIAVFLGGVGAGDIYVLLYGNSVRELHGKIFKARKLAMADMVKDNAQANWRRAYASASGKNADNDFKHRPLFADSHTTICLNSEYVPEARAKAEKKASDKKEKNQWAAISCMVQPGYEDNLYNVLRNCGRRQDFKNLEVWVMGGQHDMKLGVPYQSTPDNEAKVFALYGDIRNQLREDEHAGVHHVQLEHERQYGSTIRSGTTKIGPVDQPRALAKCRALGDIDELSDIPPFLKQSLLNLFMRYESLLAHPVGIDSVLGHSDCILALHEVIHVENSPFYRLTSRGKCEFLTSLLASLNESMGVIETLDDYGRGDFDRLLLSYNGMHKIVDACYAIQHFTWGCASAVFGWTEPIGFFPLNILTFESFTRYKSLGNGFMVFRIGVSMLVDITLSFDVVRNACRFALQTALAAPPISDTHRATSLQTNLLETLKSNLALELSNALSVDKQLVKEFADSGVDQWLASFASSGRAYSPLLAIWKDAVLKKDWIYDYLLSTERIADIAERTGHSRMKALQKTRKGIKAFVEGLEVIRNEGPEVFCDLFIMSMCRLEFDDILFLKTYDYARRHKGTGGSIFGIQLIALAVAKGQRSHYSASESLDTQMDPIHVRRIRALARMYGGCENVDELANLYVRPWISPLIYAKDMLLRFEQAEVDIFAGARETIQYATKEFLFELDQSSGDRLAILKPESQTRLFGETAFRNTLDTLMRLYYAQRARYLQKFVLPRRNIRGRHSELNPSGTWSRG